jgi:hypothetical protein
MQTPNTTEVDNCHEMERVRMNLSQSAKGSFQIDVTVESGTVERSTELLTEAVKNCRKVVLDNGFTLA